MYGMSILYCMFSAMSEPGRAGLGTLGLTEEIFTDLLSSTLFGEFEIREFDADPANRYFEVCI